MKSWIYKLLSSGKRQQDNSVELKCRNCGALMYGRFCHICGQDLFAGRKGGSGNIVFNLLDSMYSVDTKAFDTIRLLLFHPGKLTLEYYQGRIIRYLHPSKLFWFVSIVFFLYFSYRFDGGSNENKVQANAPAKTEVEAASARSSDPAQAGKEKTALPRAEPKKASGSTARSNDNRRKTWNKIESPEHPELAKEKFVSTFWAYAPYVSLVLIPFFSFLMFACFHRKVRKYSYHTMFTLHFHAFVYLFAGIVDLISDLWPSIVSGYLMIVPFIYLMFAVYVFYRPRMIPALFKMMLVAVIYFFVTVFVLILFVVFVAHKTSGEDFKALLS
jgi:hypothetical protein